MKQILLLITILIFFSSSNFATAQEPRNEDNRWEKYRAEKVSFLTDKLALTPTEAEKFWPVYNEMEKNRWEAQRARRELEAKVHDAENNLSKKEIIQLTRDYSSSMQKEGDLYIKYNEEFLKILSPEKVLNLYRSENEFRMHMIRKFRDRENHP